MTAALPSAIFVCVVSTTKAVCPEHLRLWKHPFPHLVPSKLLSYKWGSKLYLGNYGLKVHRYLDFGGRMLRGREIFSKCSSIKGRGNDKGEVLWLLTSCEARFTISPPHCEKSPGHGLTKCPGKGEQVRMIG